MIVHLYQSSQPPQPVPTEGFTVPTGNDFARVPAQAAQLLGCTPGLVDVLANGLGYIVYTVFDSDAEANPVATRAVATLTGIDFDINNEDELLRGPVLIVEDELRLL